MRDLTMSPNTINLTAVFTLDRRNIVKHWKRSDAVNCLCGTRVLLESTRTGIARECAACLRLKSAFEQQRRNELARMSVMNSDRTESAQK